MKRNQKEIHPLILAAVFHYEFVFLHPFADGNGRMARLWHTAILSQWKPIFEYIPIESQIEQFQEEYYQAIAICHQAGNSDLFIEFMLEQIDAVLCQILLRTKEDSGEIPDNIKKLLEVMEYGVSYTAGSIMEKLGIKSRETFRKNYMNPAIQMKYAEMTIPEKPNSRNQRYIRR